MTDEISKLLEFTSGKKEIACYGAGDFGRQTAAFLMEKGKRITFFVETDSNGYTEKFGIEVKRLCDIDNPLDYNWIVSVSNKYQKEVAEMLVTQGVTEYFCVSDSLIAAIRDETLEKNIELKGIGKEKRCFILGMGPTIGQQNLKLLKDEVVLSCSWCCLLDDYELISPEFYVAPAIMNDPTNGDADRFEFGRQAYFFRDKAIKSGKIILDYKDKAFVEGLGVFRDKDVYYIDQTGKWTPNTDYCDLQRKTPYIQTATVMMLKIAIYMGFEEIILLGTEHNLIKREYGHSYDIERLKEKGFNKLYEISTYHNSLVEKKWALREVLRVSYEIYNQYYLLHEIAQKDGITIINATAGGDLDEFLRADYEGLFK